MRIGYCVPIMPHLASFRLRVAIPAPHLGCDYEIGTYGDVSFFYKHFEGDIELARGGGAFVYDVVNDHFNAGPVGMHYRLMCCEATAVTTSSPMMAEIVKRATGRDAVVIDDPYEGVQREPGVPAGRNLLWFGHRANMRSLLKEIDNVADTDLIVCSNWLGATVEWSPQSERRCLEHASIVLVTGDNPGASANRIVKTLHGGRFPIAPANSPRAWYEYEPFMWIGDVKEGIAWAFANREAVCEKISQGQAYLREANSPILIAQKWMEVFDSISPQATSGKKDGSVSTATPRATTSAA